MRRLGSYFHIAMNGMAACDKIFKLLDIEETEERQKEIGVDKDIQIKDLFYSYEEDREILHGIQMELPQGKMAAIVGESGCGKSTIASILSGKNKGYKGSVYNLTSYARSEVIIFAISSGDLRGVSSHQIMAAFQKPASLMENS